MGAQEWDLWSINYVRVIHDLYDDAESWAKRLRHWSITFAFIALLGFVAVAAYAGYHEPQSKDAVTWALIRLSAWVLIAALLLFFSRTIWNYSNVWLGRAGTLEDLALALKLLGVDPQNPQSLSSAESEVLKRIVESLERLRRGFEGELLKVPSIEVPKLGS